MMLMQKPSVIESPSGRSPDKAPDGIPHVQKVAAVKKWFHGSLGSFQGIRVYIGERSRSLELRGAHEGGGGPTPGCALLPRGRLVASLTSTPSPLDCVCSKKDPREGFVPFGLRLIFLFRETLKQGRIETGTKLWVNMLVPKII